MNEITMVNSFLRKIRDVLKHNISLRRNGYGLLIIGIRGTHMRYLSANDVIGVVTVT